MLCDFCVFEIDLNNKKKQNKENFRQNLKFVMKIVFNNRKQ